VKIIRLEQVDLNEFLIGLCFVYCLES